MNRIVITLLAAAALSFARLALTSTLAQELSSSEKPSSEVVAYRMEKWRESHFQDPEKAAQHMRAVQRLGCEAWTESHVGHFDIVYRCPEWKRITMQSHKAAVEQVEQLRAAGFETHHSEVHKNYRRGNKGLEVRLTEWKVTHLEAGAKAKDLTTRLHDVGCEIRSEPHDDHVDLTYRCPVWVGLRVSDRNEAQKLQSQLDEFGFETRHTP